MNENFCDSGDIKTLKLGDPIEILDKNEHNPPGEFVFVSIEFKLQSKNNNLHNRQKLIIGNIYRSPSSNNLKFIERLGNLLSKLERHKNKIIHLVGDFNIDLAN